MPKFDLKYWEVKCLSKLGSMLGPRLKIDKYTKEKTMLNYVRLLVQMHIDGPFPEYIEFANEKDVLIRQKVHHEWKPTKCTYCKMFGYTLEQRKKKNHTKKEWRVKAQVPPPVSMPP